VVSRLGEVEATMIDWRYKSFPPGSTALAADSLAAQQWNALTGDLLFPVALVKESALNHNITLMAEYCLRNGVSFAPHAKTPISPEIVKAQLAAGAYGITTANFHQSRVMRHFGVTRILLANELLERRALRWVIEELGRDPSFDFTCLVDSVAGVAIMDEELSGLESASRIKVLVEVGTAGGRAGVRSSGEGIEVATAVRDSRWLRLAGVEGYEGMVANNRSEKAIHDIDAFMAALRDLAGEMDRRHLFGDTDEVIVSAGGSMYPDRAIAGLKDAPWNLERPVRIVLRSGSYITHAAGRFDETAAFGSRHHASPTEALQQALEIWGMVLSRPEPELAIVGFGKRDVAYDDGLPIPFEIRYRSGERAPVGDEMSILSLNDQHARVGLPQRLGLGPGDLVGFHITHPCTTFDKWRLLPVVDDDYCVVGTVTTYF
jgi:D-serine dehydratase